MSFSISLYCRTNHFTLFQSFFSPICFTFPPLGLVTHFSLFPTLFTFLTSFSQLASLPVLLLCCVSSASRNCLCQYDGCELDWRGEYICKVSKAQALSTIHLTWVHARSGFRASALSLPLFIPPTFPRGYYWQTPRHSPLNRVLVHTLHDAADIERSRYH